MGMRMLISTEPVIVTKFDPSYPKISKCSIAVGFEVKLNICP